jgi:ATP-dependent DNA ligase
MTAPFRPMLPTAVAAPPAAEGWVHEGKLDGYRCLAQVKPSRARLWSRAGTEWTDRLPELAALTSLGNVILDGEVVVVTPDGRADFELLGARIHGPRHAPHSQPVTFYVFDVLQFGHQDLRDQPWVERRQVLDDLDVAARSGGAARPTICVADGAAMHEATRAVQAEGTVSKRVGSVYRPGRSRQWLKAKHKVEEKLQVAGWRPSTPARPGGLILAEHGEPIGVGALAMLARQRVALIDLLQRYGRHHPSGVVMIPQDRIQAIVHYTARTPTHGHLREAFVVGVEAIGSDGIDGPSPRDPSCVPAS